MIYKKLLIYILLVIYILMLTGCAQPKTIKTIIIVYNKDREKKVEVVNEHSDKTSIWDFLATSLGVIELFS